MQLPGRLWIFSLLTCALMLDARSATVKESLQFVSRSKEFVEVKATESLAIDLRYASTNNFVGQNLYGEFNKV